MKKQICHCENVDFGTYKNTVSMKTLSGKWVSIDTCIATEIGYLWHQGVETLNSCCGHKKIPPGVVVSTQSIEKMKKLGYKTTDLNVAMPENTFSLTP